MNLVSVGGMLYFIADGSSLWKSDGTDAGTVAVGPTFYDP